MRLGVISDTHGKLPADVAHVFAGVDRIIHAGDIGTGVAEELELIAPVVAVSGNTDIESRLPLLANVSLDGVRVLVVHRPVDVPRPLPEGVGVVIVGHTHVPLLEQRGAVLWVNPGSAARSRGAGHTVAILTLEAGTASAELFDIG